MEILYSLSFVGLLSVLIMGCGKSDTDTSTVPNFTKVDSLTERYLEIQEGLLESWNHIMHNEKKKMYALNNVIHELMHSGNEDNSELVILEGRLKELTKEPITLDWLRSPDQLEQYDFATSNVVSEIIGIAESHSTYSYNQTLQKLVEDIKYRDQQVNVNRGAYDSVARIYNEFISSNKDLVKEIDHASPDHQPLFGVTKE